MVQGKKYIINNPSFVTSYYVSQEASQKYAHLLHKHDDVLEILYIYSGEGSYIVGQREYSVRPGDIVLCNAGIVHGNASFIDENI